jgi:transcriptional regulator with XRE-family HTH domain
MNFGARVKTAREARGWSQNQLARLAKVNQSTLQRIEANPKKDPELSNCVKIARALGMPVEALLDGQTVEGNLGDGVRNLDIPEGTYADVEGDTVVVKVLPGAVLYGGPESELLDKIKQIAISAIGAIRPPAASADGKGSPDPSADSPRVLKLEADMLAMDKTVRALQRSLKSTPAARGRTKKESRGA